MFGENLVLLHWNDRKAGWLEQPEQSSFYRSDADFQTFIEKNIAMLSISKTNAKADIYLKLQLTEGTTKSVRRATQPRSPAQWQAMTMW